jgi:hypothetical protein
VRDSFNECMELGGQGESLVRYGLQKVYNDVKKVPSTINEQLVWGDLVVPGYAAMGIKNMKVEVKTERKHTGNLFWEWWSNKSTKREGWGQTSPADELYYLFWDDGAGYRIPDLQTVIWHVDYHKNDFQLVKQCKQTQDNDTWGYLIPIEWFSQANNLIKFDFNNLRNEIMVNVADTKKARNREEN